MIVANNIIRYWNMLQHMRLPSVSVLKAFESVARHGGITRAAIELGLTQSAVSRQIQHMEESLGVRLFHRTRQRLILTDTGETYAASVRHILAELASATENLVAGAGSDDSISLAILPTLGTRWLIPRLPNFLASNPKVAMSFAVRLRPFDFRDTNFDMAIHFGAPEWPDAVCNHLMDETMVVVASPSFRKMHNPRKPVDLLSATLLHQITRPAAWSIWFANAGVSSAGFFPGPRFDQFAMVIQGAVSSIGAALVPLIHIEEELRTGQLEILFPKHTLKGGSYYIVAPETKAERPIIKKFMKWMAGEVTAKNTGVARLKRRRSSRVG